MYFLFFNPRVFRGSMKLQQSRILFSISNLIIPTVILITRRRDILHIFDNITRQLQL